MWYIASLIVKCNVAGRNTGPWTVQEQIRLIEATDDDSAFEKAVQLGKAEEHSYLNSDGEEVSWEFIGLEDLEDLSQETLQDGMELRCRFLTRETPLDLISTKSELSVFKSQHLPPT